MHNPFKHIRLHDVHQNWWQLAAIQLTGITCLPALAVSVLILQKSNFISAVITLIIGNILLWMLGWAMISMSHEGRKSVLEVTYNYLGKTATYIIAILLLASLFAWFIVQTTLASNALSYLIPLDPRSEINHFMQIGVLLGMLSTLLCINGMVTLKWLSVISLPILLIALIGVIYNSDPVMPIQEHKSFSFSGLPILLIAFLDKTVDYPTYFRHSNSLKSSICALTVIQIITFLVGLMGLFLGSMVIPWLGINETNGIISDGMFLRSFLIILIFFSAICINVVNVYSASIGWEIIAPIFAGIKEYLILGLGSTILFILGANIFSTDFLIHLTGATSINLCFVLIIGYFIRLFMQLPPNASVQKTYFIAWLFSSIVNILQFLNLITLKIEPMVLGLMIILITITFLISLKRVLKHFKY